MKKIEKHKTKKGEVSLIAFKQNGDKSFKVTRRLSKLSVSETRIFDNLENAKEKFEEWLN